jgi:hypothetical protein
MLIGNGLAVCGDSLRDIRAMWRSDIGNSARFYTHEFQYGSDFNNGQLKIMRVSVKWDEIEEVGRNKKPYVSNLTIL